MKPVLTEVNKLERIHFCLDAASDNGLYDEMEDRVHIDDKWFYLSQVLLSYYQVEGEDEKIRRGRSTNTTRMPKLMFLAAVGRPRHDMSRNQPFDGKLGMWPLATRVPAKRTSVNRVRGTLEWKRIKKIKQGVYEDYLFSKVVPSILTKWPRTNRRVLIQQDNASAHCSPERFAELWEEKKVELHAEYLPAFEFEIILYCQPPNSPDLNVLDLGLFRALQSMQWKEEAKNMNEMVQRVLNVFQNWPSQRLENTFFTLQCVMNQVIEYLGDNDYKLEHMNKQRLERLSQLPRSIRVTDDSERFIEDEDGA